MSNSGLGSYLKRSLLSNPSIRSMSCEPSSTEPLGDRVTVTLKTEGRRVKDGLQSLLEHTLSRPYFMPRIHIFYWTS
jgi:hypothetical protein